MLRHILIPSYRVFTWFTFLLGLALPAAAAADARVSESYGKLPLHFEANQGQAHEDVRFLARGSGYSLYLTSGEAVFVLAQPNLDKKRNRHGKRDWQSKHERPKTQVMMLRMAIVGAHPAPLVSGLDELPGKANYFTGNDPAKWRTNVPTYAKVHYREVYPGIDLVYYGNQRQLEYDFIITPGADPQRIMLDFQGADRVEVNAEGELVLHLAKSTFRQRKPVIYQEVGGIRREIAGGYVLQGANRVGFHVAAYDASRPLVIDPVLSYSTFLGRGGFESSSGIAVDADGNAYVTGLTNATDFPTTAGAFQTTCSATQSNPSYCWDGNAEVFVTKINPTGSALVYSTYLGGNGYDRSAGIAVDTAGNAYVTGIAEVSPNELGVSNFPTTPGAFQPTFAGGIQDAFVTKLNPTGSALIYSTFLGGRQDDVSTGIAVDADGNAYVAGVSGSLDFPATPGAYRTSGPGAFVAKLNPAGSALVYSTFFDGGGIFGIAVDTGGNAYVTGDTNSTSFPTTPGAFQPIYGGGDSDAFVTKLDATGSALVYSTYLGGSSTSQSEAHDVGFAIAVDADGNAYVTGSTNSTNFPITAGAFQLIHGGGNYDAFVTKLNPSGSALVYSTFLGGSGSDGGSGIAVDASGNAYVTGSTTSLNYPTTPGAPQSAFGGGPSEPGIGPPSDAFVTKLNPAGSGLAYSTYLGGSPSTTSDCPGCGGSDGGTAITVDANGNAYVTGWTNSPNFPTTAGTYQPDLSGGSQCGACNPDAFVVKIADDTPPPPTTPSRSEESAATYMGYWPSYGAETGTFSGGAIVASNQVTATATFSFTGTGVSWIGVKCNVCGVATVSIDGGLPTTVDTFGPGEPGSLTSEPVFSASGLAPGVNHTITITVTGATTNPQALLSNGTHVAVDAFDVTTDGSAAPPPLLPPLALPPLPLVPGL